MRTYLFLLILIFSFSTNSFSQDDLANYKRAKTLIGYGNYSDAMDLLRPYMEESQFGNLAFYAQYHFGFSAFQNNQIELAKSIIKPLADHKNWIKKDETRYLLALIYFEETRNIEALQEIAQIKNPDIFAQGERASLNYLGNASVSFLVANLSKFKNNNGFLVTLREQLEKQSIMSADEKILLQQLKSNENPSNPLVSNNKNIQSLDISILLPFNYAGGTDVKTITQGNFVLELYQGVRFALDELIANGYKINVRTYDTQRDNTRLLNILNDPFLMKSDVIIGPIYPEETEMVLQFSQKNNIPFINPLSNLDDKIEGYENAYLFRPAVSSLSKGLLKYLEVNTLGKSLAIGYSSTARDEQLMNKLIEDATNRGFKIVSKTLVSPKNINQFFDSGMNSSSKADAIILISDDPNIAQGSFGYLESKNLKTPVIVMDSWLFFNFASYEMMENQNFVFLGNNSIDFNNPNLENFRSGFNEEYGKFPSLNMHLGYELTHWIAETINPSKGFDLRKNLNQNKFKPGKITFGFDFTNANNNRYVPVLKLYNGKLEVN
jgi:ABC-type branched-subunit amino acid transport system substrate-binding protein